MIETSPRWDRFLKRYSWLILAVICLLGYMRSLNGGFMIDDHLVLFGQSGVENMSFGQLFLQIQTSFYRPVGHIFLWLSYRLFHYDPFLYHLANLFLFILIVCLFEYIVRLLSGNRFLSLTVAALYALHPINNMLINYVTANIISTYVLMQQIAFISFIYYLKKGFNRKYYLLSLFFLLLSLLSHEGSIAFPLYLFCLLSFLYGYSTKKTFKRIWPFIMTVAVFFVIRQAHFRIVPLESGVIDVFPHPQMYLNSVAKMICWYLSKLLIPVHIVFLWSFFIGKNMDWLSLSVFLLASGGCIYVIFFRWKRGIKAFALAFFLSGLFPLFIASFVYAVRERLIAIVEPHWFYFSSFGFFLLFGVILFQLKARINKVVWASFVLALLCCELILLDRSNDVWRDQETYCCHWIAQSQNNATPYYWLGRSRLEKGDYQGAVICLTQALKIDGFSRLMILSDLAYVNYLTGFRDSSRAYLERMIQTEPNYSMPYYYLAEIYAREGKYQKAKPILQRALELYPDRKYIKLMEQLNKGM